MAIIALVSGKGSPGVTTAALACTLTWHRRLVLAECDPAGGSILAGYLGGALDGRRGIGELAVAELRDGNLEAHFWSQLVDLDAPRRERLLLPGVVDPAQAGSVTPLWQRFADFFGALDRGQPPLRRAGRLWPDPGRRTRRGRCCGPRRRCWWSPAPGWPTCPAPAARSRAIERDFTDHRVPPGQPAAAAWSATGTRSPRSARR